MICRSSGYKKAGGLIKNPLINVGWIKRRKRESKYVFDVKYEENIF